MDAVRKLILEKLAERGLTMKEASLRIGKSHSYLQQFLKRGTPEQLGEYEREALAALLGVPEGSLRGTSPRLPKRDYKLHEPVATTPRVIKLTDVGHNLIDIVSPTGPLFGDHDLPVFGTAQGGSGGALIMSKEAVTWVLRPAPLLRVRDGYGMIVTGDSMSPKIENGSTVLVNPHLPPRNGDLCVLRKHLEDGTTLAVLTLLRRFNDETWFVHQLVPAKDFSLKRSEWQHCHVVIGSYFGR
jgi:phage repressor protein C with HTH and peptisase S24 domain